MGWPKKRKEGRLSKNVSQNGCKGIGKDPKKKRAGGTVEKSKTP